MISYRHIYRPLPPFLADHYGHLATWLFLAATAQSQMLTDRRRHMVASLLFERGGNSLTAPTASLKQFPFATKHLRNDMFPAQRRPWFRATPTIDTCVRN